MESGVGRIQLPPGSTAEEYREAIAKQPKVRKWWKADNFENGKTYRIGFDEGSAIKKWFEGSTEELLRKPLDDRTDGKMNKEPVMINAEDESLVEETSAYANI
ncbi:hypothetical protein J7337_002103 [Fusarium musae]|uniref:Uncharacterized protein n=1 Tax=Fusarium musae TaxID=1042133 RepID=A0A9P8DNR8_9HYPO|nr:hypothetical protein J7337_002103 [Fusarium musae]KAG9505137.1 hypothetical protein J7337_002103 [Fusarium musae]